MAYLVTELGKAFESVKKLNISIMCLEDAFPDKPRGTHLKHKRQSIEEGVTSAMTEQDPNGLSTISRGVFSLLAAALPNLEELSQNEGSCFDAAFDVFGTLCPKFRSLHVHVPHVPISALKDVSQTLLNLTSITISMGYIQYPGMQHLLPYLEAILLAIQNCKNLTSLEIEGDNDLSLISEHLTWSILPKSLKHLHISCPMTCSDGFIKAAGKLPSLALDDLPCAILELFQRFPAANSVKFLGMGGSISLDCAASVADTRVLKQRFLDRKFQLDCTKIALLGTFQEVGEMLSWPPAFSLVYNVQLRCKGDVDVSCLVDLQRVFPHLLSISTGRVENWEELLGIVPVSFGPLSSCEVQVSAAMHEQFVLAADAMTQLCRAVTALVRVKVFVGTADIDADALLDTGGPASQMPVAQGTGTTCYVQRENDGYYWLARV